MIKIVRGDLLKAKENIIGHSVNCQGAMNSGVAKQIREQFPHVFLDYREIVYNYKKEDKQKELLGKTQIINIDRKKYVANIFGQYDYGYDGKVYTDTEALFSSFKTVRKQAEKLGLSVALPYMIGCYRGGADWKLVEDHILTAFDGYEVTLYKHHMG